ncbi:hypothetical protein EC973_000872 [Apophysomyces ossiformis]|uniref:Uncharacterized protein n=1 Tax=Apophysomyces ossiformis TaxID=679940 RepID=A0A8H7BL53_9FUNG|nr:hypothetical protein EC973_000872 [Apophysomyces ossiformis]
MDYRNKFLQMDNLNVYTLQAKQKRVRVGLSKRIGQMSSINSPVSVDATVAWKNPSESSSYTAASASAFVTASSIVVGEEGQSSDSIGSSSVVGVPHKKFVSPLAEGVGVPLVLQFPSYDKATSVLKSKKQPKRNKVVPTRFANTAEYKETFQKLIHEHLQIKTWKGFSARKDWAFMNIAISKGMQDPTFRPVFDSDYEAESIIQNIMIFGLSLNHPDLTLTQHFSDAAYFMGHPQTACLMLIDCVTPRDARIANNLVKDGLPIYALRTISANTEFMMIGKVFILHADTLDKQLDQCLILPKLLSDGKNKRKKVQADINPPRELDYIKLYPHDNVNVENKIEETIKRYRLNEDQESVLRAVANSVIVAPGWNDEAKEPVTLVHGNVTTKKL